VLGQMPLKSGSPHAVRGGVHALFDDCWAPTVVTQIDPNTTAADTSVLMRTRMTSSSSAAGAVYFCAVKMDSKTTRTTLSIYGSCTSKSLNSLRF